MLFIGLSFRLALHFVRLVNLLLVNLGVVLGVKLFRANITFVFLLFGMSLQVVPVAGSRLQLLVTNLALQLRVLKVLKKTLKIFSTYLERLSLYVRIHVGGPQRSRLVALSAHGALIGTLSVVEALVKFKLSLLCKTLPTLVTPETLFDGLQVVCQRTLREKLLV